MINIILQLNLWLLMPLLKKMEGVEIGKEILLCVPLCFSCCFLSQTLYLKPFTKPERYKLAIFLK